MGGVLKIILTRMLPAVVLLVAVVLGWFFSHDVPLGVFFATMVPVMKGQLPPTVFGHGRMKGTPEVPDDMLPLERPANEILLDLPDNAEQKLPAAGLGMCCRPTAYDHELAYRTVLWYLLLGGRHVDGAHLYLNHEPIGRAVREAVRRGVPREEIFVTTKIFPTLFGYDSAKEWIPKYLEELGLEYVDMVLMHFPSAPWGMSSTCKKSAAECRRETWRAMSEFRDLGLVRNVGVSNFALSHLKDLEGLGAPIANNQIEYSPFVPQSVEETMEYCARHNITITAYSPLGGLLNQDKAFVQDQLKAISAKYDDRRVSQIMLRWALQRGAAVIPGTGNPEHMKENLGIFGFELSEADMDTINGLKHSDEAKNYFHMDTRKVK